MAEPVTNDYVQRSYAGGMNATALPTTAIRGDEVSLLVNGTVRNGFPRTRPGWHYRPLAFVTPGSQGIFENGRYQGSCFYMHPAGPRFAVAVDGRIFLVDPTNWTVEMLTTKPVPTANTVSQWFSEYSPHVWMIQRNKWLIAQDGISAPVVYDGVEAVQGTGPEKVPTGTMMVDGWHRLAVVSPDRRRIYFSDHELDPNSTPISFTEGTDYFLNARYFEAPPALGRIVGLAFTPYQDTSTGIGPLVVFCERGTRAYNIAVPRSDWVTQDISQTILPRVGASSFFSYTDKGSQLVFRDHDGRIRTIKNAQQTEATDSNFSTDFEIRSLLESEDASLREYSQSVTFDGRCLMLTHPQREHLPDLRQVVYHRGVAVLENEHLSDKENVWAFWTGKRICGLEVGQVAGKDVCVAFCRDPDGRTRLYELTRSQRFDTVPAPEGIVEKRIEMLLSTPTTDFGNPVAIKKFSGGGMRLTAMRGQVDITARWQADGAPPTDWFSHSEAHPTCAQFSDCLLTFLADGANPRFAFPAIPDKNARGYKARPILTFRGPVQVEELALVAAVIPASGVSGASCSTVQLSPARVVCDVDIFAYDAMLAPTVNQPNVTPCP